MSSRYLSTLRSSHLHSTPSQSKLQFNMLSSLLVKTIGGVYHVYKVLWEPQVCETLSSTIQGTNVTGMPWLFTEMKNIIGHLPQEIAKTTDNT